ncbi:MAG: CBS domain-containing protein [Longispora sp.]|nr:CBS domain-containing protein [Longispora sp. (in: high G+C Gram-positive bacteria)]
MTKAKDIMHHGVECVSEGETLDRAAQMMREHNVGSLPICGTDGKLTGIITDRDIVVRCVAMGQDPSKMRASDLAQGTPVWCEANADVEEVVQIMGEHHIRRLPVMENKRLVGIISEADLAVHLPKEQLAEFCESVYSAPPTVVARPM